jgi:hypothetical protein
MVCIAVLSTRRPAGHRGSARPVLRVRGRGSAGDHVDDDGCRVAQNVIDGGTLPGLLDDAAQRRVVGVALDVEVTLICS